MRVLFTHEFNYLLNKTSMNVRGGGLKFTECK